MNKVIDPGQLMGFRIEKAAAAHRGVKGSLALGVKTGEKAGGKETISLIAAKIGLKAGDKGGT